MCPVVSIHVVGVVKEMGNVGGVLLSKKPDAVIARVVAAAGQAVGQEEKEEPEMQHTSFQQHGQPWRKLVDALCKSIKILNFMLLWMREPTWQRFLLFKLILADKEMRDLFAGIL